MVKNNKPLYQKGHKKEKKEKENKCLWLLNQRIGNLTGKEISIHLTFNIRVHSSKPHELDRIYTMCSWLVGE